MGAVTRRMGDDTGLLWLDVVLNPPLFCLVRLEIRSVEEKSEVWFDDASSTDVREGSLFLPGKKSNVGRPARWSGHGQEPTYSCCWRGEV